MKVCSATAYVGSSCLVTCQASLFNVSSRRGQFGLIVELGAELKVGDVEDLSRAC